MLVVAHCRPIDQWRIPTDCAALAASADRHDRTVSVITPTAGRASVPHTLHDRGLPHRWPGTTGAGPSHRQAVKSGLTVRIPGIPSWVWCAVPVPTFWRRLAWILQMMRPSRPGSSDRVREG